MSIVRSGSPGSRRRQESTETETDRSLNTPATSGTAQTSTSEQTSRKYHGSVARGPQAPTHGRTTRSIAAAAASSSLEPPSVLATSPRAGTGTFADPAFAPPAVSPVRIPQPHTRTESDRTVRPRQIMATDATTAPHDPRARATLAAARSTKSSRRTELEARLALQKKQLEAARNAVALAETELALAQYQSGEDEEFNAEFEHERSTHVEQWVDRTTYLEPQDERDRPKSEIKELAEAIISATQAALPARQKAPPKIWDLPDFDGSYEDWLPFRRAYLDSKDLCTEVHNMARLRKAIKGAAKDAVRSLLFASADPNEVIAALENRFGRPDQLALAELQRIKNLGKVNDNPREMCAFANHVSNSVAAITALGKPQYLHSPEVIKCIVDKLSSISRYRWFDYSASLDDNEPALTKMKKFLEREADICSAHAPTEIISLKRDGRCRVNAIEHETHRESETVTNTQEAYKKFCFKCEKDHWLTECPLFKEATNDERWEIAKEKKLCFRCLRRRHMRNNCRGSSCKKCRRPHHVMLHLEPASPAPSTQTSVNDIAEKEVNIVKSVYAVADGTKVLLKMIPVDVFGPNGSVRITALLDEGSTVSLIDAEVADRIGAKGTSAPLTIETVGGKLIEKPHSQRMDLRIKGAHRRDKRTLKGVRTVEDLKLSPQTVCRKEIEQCGHLKDILNEITYERGKPELLIGQDNWDLIVSRKIVKGKQSEPAASLTGLGWVLHGCCTGSSAATVCYVNHCYTPNESEDIENVIKRHFELDSIGIEQRRPHNDADRRALTVLKETTRRLPDGSYESGLLWKTDNETLPNNYAGALNRLRGVEKKISKDPALKEEYNKQLLSLMNNGYAEEAPEQSTPGRTFYLPHFAVMHPQKKKMRIVFDAAAKFEGKSLNDALLPGPDLLQPLFGVLLRFRERPVAVVADIKEMFLRIKMRKEDRDSLRFLWRDENKHSKPKEYRMTSVIFGAASSPATAIYVKNLNAERYEKEHPDAVKAIIRHHYMDDYLQSFATIEEAQCTAEKLNEIQKEAGLCLRQWASNMNETLKNLKCKEGVKERKLGAKKIEEYTPIDDEYILKAERALIRQSQDESFHKEIVQMQKGTAIEKSSPLKGIDVRLNDEGILYLSSRTQRLTRHTESSELAVLHGKQRIVQLIIGHYHGSHATIFNELRQKYWIIGLRNAVRKVAHLCQWCIVRKTKPNVPPTGNLPPERLAFNRPPFTCVGVDYFGPMHVTIGRRREKRWGVLFTCLTTRAIHIELAASLNTSSMIMALRRMSARRGSPRILYSDNGTNFHGANNELMEEAHKINSDAVIEAAEREGVQWKFTPPGAPHMGGAWERLIGVVKTALAAVLGHRNPPEEVLHTLLTEVEHTVNSRPLTHIDTDPDDEEALTPNHFLIGRSSGTSIIAQTSDGDLVGKPNWKTAQRLADHFWARWLREYLPSLMPRRLKGRPRRECLPGDVVIIADASLPRNTWPRGVIESVYPGPDGHTRIVDVRTKGGVMRRPVSRLIHLTTSQHPESRVPDLRSNTGGRLSAASRRIEI